MMRAAERNVITLRGSTELVTQYFTVAVNSILYQRGIYPPDNFRQQTAFGIAVMVSTDPGLTKYLVTVLQQMSGAVRVLTVGPTAAGCSHARMLSSACTDWLLTGGLRRMVLVVSSAKTKATCERWTFEIQAQPGKENSE